MSADLSEVLGEGVVAHASNLRRPPGGSHRRNRSIWPRSQVRAEARPGDSPSLGGYGGRSHIVAERQPRQLGARGQSELREDASQVRIDCSWREEQHRCNFLVRKSFSDETGNLKLLRRQLFNGARVSLPRRLPGGPELGGRSLGPGCGAKAPECLEG